MVVGVVATATKAPCRYVTENQHFEPKVMKLVGGFNPSEKYARQIGHLPQIGVKIKNI